MYTGFTESTDLSRVTIDTQPPLTPISNISSGTYTVAQSVILTSSLNSSIHFTLDGSTANCLSSNVYLIPLLISSSTTIKSISCDLAGNISSVSTFSYTIFPDTVNIPNEIGTDSQESTSESEESVDQEIEDESNEIVDQKEDGTITYSGKVTQKDGEEVISVLKIRVLDPELNPLIYTEVTIYSSPQRSRTDLNGIATFYDIPLGEHTIVYSYDGEQQREEIQLGDGLKEGLYTFESVDIITKGKGSLPIYAYILILISIAVTYFLSKRLIEKRGKRV